MHLDLQKTSKVKDHSQFIFQYGWNCTHRVDTSIDSRRCLQIIYEAKHAENRLSEHLPSPRVCSPALRGSSFQRSTSPGVHHADFEDQRSRSAEGKGLPNSLVPVRPFPWFEGLYRETEHKTVERKRGGCKISTKIEVTRIGARSPRGTIWRCLINPLILNIKMGGGSISR